MCHVQLWLRVMAIRLFVVVVLGFLLILCNFYSFTSHNSVTVGDMLMHFYRNV